MRLDADHDPSRRAFFAAGLASVAALALTKPSLATLFDEYGPFKFGIQSYSLRHFKFDEALAKTKELGLHYWESYSNHTPVDPSKTAEIRKQAAEQGVTILGFGVSNFSKDHDANRKLFEFGKSLGVTSLSADPNPDAFDSLDKLVEEYGIAIGIHNHGPGHRYDTIERIQAAIKDHHPKIGCCIDCGHFLRSGIDPVQAVEAFDSRIFGVHLKDVKGTKTFTVLGEGDLRTAEVLKALAKRKYGYILALEYEEHPEAPMDDLRACLAATKKAAVGL